MTHRHASVFAGLTALALSSACADDGQTPPADTDEPEATGTSTGEAADQVLYHEDIRPILAQHCGSCHSEGAIGPFTIQDYEETREWGGAILAAMQARTMPPFGVNNDGSCNTFTDARWVSDEEIEAVAAWVEADYPEGDASIPTPDNPQLATLTGEVTNLGLPLYEPQVVPEYGGFEDYHCFAVELDIDEPQFITGFDVAPGNAQLVHHVLGFRVDPDFFGNREQMEALDAMSPDVPGWDCFGAAGDDVFPAGVPVTWAPGTGAVEYPEGTGIRFEPGDVLVVQMHYDLAEASGMDQSEVLLKLAPEVEREAHQILWDPFLFSEQFGNPLQLPPGEQAATYTWDEQMREMTALDNSGAGNYEEVEILGLIPHMHQRGTTMTIDFETEASGMQCGADVDRWDFNWQINYFLEEPLRVSMTDRMHVTCEWNTMGDTNPIFPGFGSDDEMCLVGVMFAPL
ncbi:MAG: hypothetical protein AAF799_37655 [Myxococcota bacterium]